MEDDANNNDLNRHNRDDGINIELDLVLAPLVLLEKAVPIEEVKVTNATMEDPYDMRHLLDVNYFDADL